MWKVSVDGSNVTLNGQVNANVHYFENGNVQLNTSFTPSITVDAGADAAKAVASAIQKQELAYHTSLEEAFANLPTSTFKTLRRALPLTKQQANWAAMGSYKLGGEIARKK